MTQPPALVAPYRMTAEQQAEAQAWRYSKTSLEREDVARVLHGILAAHKPQHPVEWLKARGFSHGSAVNLKAAGEALAAGAATGQGVSKLAKVGGWLKKTDPATSAPYTLAEAQRLANDTEAAKEATAAQRIGIGTVQYPTSAAQEVAGIYAALAETCEQAGVPVPPDTAEMTLLLARVAKSNLTPAAVQQAELGGARVRSDPPTPPLDLYTWLARQRCAVCGTTGTVLHHVWLPDLPGAPGGRRHHDHKAQELLLPLCPPHHDQAQHAAHTMKQAEWSRSHWGHEQGAVIRAARYVTEYAQEMGLLRST